MFSGIAGSSAGFDPLKVIVVGGDALTIVVVVVSTTKDEDVVTGTEVVVVATDPLPPHAPSNKANTATIVELGKGLCSTEEL